MRLKNVSTIVDAKPNQFVRLTKSITAYKAAFKYDEPSQARLLVTLRIPAGAIVYTGSELGEHFSFGEFRKMRCDVAFVKRIRTIKEKTLAGFWRPVTKYYLGTDKKTAYSGHGPAKTSDSDFQVTYHVGHYVHPVGPRFSFVRESCNAGIHFFLDARAATAYKG